MTPADLSISMAVGERLQRLPSCSRVRCERLMPGASRGIRTASMRRLLAGDWFSSGLPEYPLVPIASGCVVVFRTHRNWHGLKSPALIRETLPKSLTNFLGDCPRSSPIEKHSSFCKRASSFPLQIFLGLKRCEFLWRLESSQSLPKKKR